MRYILEELSNVVDRRYWREHDEQVYPLLEKLSVVAEPCEHLGGTLAMTNIGKCLSTGFI